MLFAYTYVPHKIEKMQAFINFIFFEVWCVAPVSGSFQLELFDANLELKELMVTFYYGDTQGGDYFYGHVERIYGLFAALKPHQVDQLKCWYQANNNIEEVCANTPAVQIAHYNHIAEIHPDLSKELASFFKRLYSQQLLNLAAIRAKIGDINDHYQKFMQMNKVTRCPFCGLGDIKGSHHTKREAYDHYLPKGLYPFNSINFRNLAPACHDCNSTYKLTKDPAHHRGERRKAFYPYSPGDHAIEITVTLGTSDIDNLDPEDIHLTFGPPIVCEEIETWKEVYGIVERYKAKCCDHDAKDWLEQIRILYDEYGLDSQALLATVRKQTQKAPYANSNFLKKAFLEGCKEAGVLDALDVKQ